MINFGELESEKYWTAKTKDEIKKAIFSGEYLGSEKKDGAYYRLWKDEEGNLKLQGRSRGVNGEFSNKVEWVPQFKDFFESLPNGTCLLGELYFPNNRGSNHVTTIMGCKVDKAIARQADSKLFYYIFDIWAYNGESFLYMSAAERFKKLKELSKKFFNPYLEWASYKEGEELLDLIQTVLENDGEGAILTKKNSFPEPGKRTAHKTLKIKLELNKTIDCFFTGRFTEPTKEYTGKEIETWLYWEDARTGELKEGKFYLNYFNGEPLIPVTKLYFYGGAGSLEIGVLKDNTIVPIGFLSGLNEEIKLNPLSVKGRPIEVTAMEFTEDKKLRHGKLVQFRDDLNITDCTYEKIFE